MSPPSSDDGASVRRRVFALTWVSYASYYLTRKNFSVAKKTLERTLHIDRSTLGAIDSAYLTSYAFGQFVWGSVGDRVGARRVVVAGMIATACCSVAFGLSSTPVLFALCFGLNGLAQSTGWPANIKLMSDWFSPARRGAVMGFWSTCYQVGSLAANPVAAFLIVRWSWRAAFFAPALFVVAVALALMALLPREAPPRPPSKDASAPPVEEMREARARVVRTPLVWALGGSYFFIKLTRYVLLFWLPYFMEAEDGLRFSTSVAAWVPNAFEVGGVIGAVAIGWWSDRRWGGKRLGVGALFLVGLAAALVAYGYAAPRGIALNVVALAVVGFFLFGPDTLLSGAAAQDLGGPAAATAAGIVNGVGSFGPILGGTLTAHVSKGWGWGALFALLGAGSLLSALALVPFLASEKGRGSAPRDVD